MAEITPGTRSADAVGLSLDGDILTIWLRRSETLNAINADMLDDLADFVEHAPESGARVIALRAEGRGFCSGADIGTTAEDADPQNRAGTQTIDAGERLIRAITTSPLPVVSVVQGPCAGIGVPIALSADLTLASDQAFFMLAFTKIGLMPDGGATALVAASVGRSVAMRMALLAERLPAHEAARLGLIASVTPAADFESHVETTLSQLTGGPSVAFARTKSAINDATLGSLDHAFTVELQGQASLLSSDDFHEGTAAFRDKRVARFTDR